MNHCMDWFSKNLGDAMLAGEAIDSVEARFQAAYAQAGYPNEMAVFMRHESEGRLHCEVMTYFSPAAVDVAREVGAGPCTKPSPIGLSLLGGAEEAGRALFVEC